MTIISGAKKTPETTAEKEDTVDLKLYVTDDTPRCLTAYENIKNICEEYTAGTYHITVIDLLKCPSLARTDNITAVPTLVRVLPRTTGRRKIIGTLTDTQKVIEALDLTTGRAMKPNSMKREVFS
jgi:circadian clock protein KaiB